VILYNVPESKGVTAEDRNREDGLFSLQLFYKLQVGVSDEDIDRVFRLGKRTDPSTPNASPRPLLVQFGSCGIKNLVMESLYNLKNVEQKFTGVNIAHDMTPKERIECKRLLAEAKQKQAEDSSGEYIYRFCGYPGKMKIVPLKVRHDTSVKRV